MDELQQARGDYVSALEKICTLERQLSDKDQECYALQMKLYVAEARASSLEAMHEGFVAGLLGIAR